MKNSMEYLVQKTKNRNIMHMSVAQLCPTLWEPTDCSLPSSSVGFMVFSRQEYWSGLSFPLPGNLPHLGIEPESPALQVYSLILNHQGRPTSRN